MAFQSLTQIKKSAGINPKSRARNLSDISISTDKMTTQAGVVNWTLRVSIAQEIAKLARLIPGDRVELFIDRDSSPARGLLKRTLEGGMRLTGSDSSRLVMKSTYREGAGMPSFAKTEDASAVVTEEGILFDMPPRCSFDENLRLKQEGLF